MGLFRNYRQEEEHLIALEVIESDRRTKTQFELRKKNSRMERIIATMAATALLYFLFTLLPKQNELDRSKEHPANNTQVVNF